jgi:hypothetical protein
MLTKSFRISPHEDASTTDDVESFVKSLSAHASPGKVGLRINSDSSDFAWFKWTLFPLCDTYVDGGWDIRVVYEGEYNDNLMCGMYKNKAYDVGVVLMEQLEFESFVEWEREALPNQVDAMRKDLESQAVTCTDEDLTAYSGLLIRSYFMWYDKHDLLISSYLMLYDDRGKKLPKAAPEPKKKMSAQEKTEKNRDKRMRRKERRAEKRKRGKADTDVLLEEILAGVEQGLPKM